MKIAVLALQGAFIEHIRKLSDLGAETLEIRQRKDIGRSFDGLVIPGGESTVMGKLLSDMDMLHPLQQMITKGLPVFGTCAGMILLAKKIVNSDIRHLATMDISVVRNAYGRQLGSFEASGSFAGIENVPMTFIRAPFISESFGTTEILSSSGGKSVAARQGKQLVTAFHPELTNDIRVHEYFLNLIKI